MKILKNDWHDLMKDEFKGLLSGPRQFLKTEYRTRTIYPDMYDIFNATLYTLQGG